MTRSQYIKRIVEQYGHYPTHPSGHPFGHPYEMHHYQASLPAHHPDSHAYTGEQEDDSPPPKKKSGFLKGVATGTVLGAGGVLAYAKHLHDTKMAQGGA